MNKYNNFEYYEYIAGEILEIRELANKGIQEKNNDYIIEAKERMEELNTYLHEDKWRLEYCGLFGAEWNYRRNGDDWYQICKDDRVRSWEHLHENMNAIYDKYVNNKKVSIRFSAKEKEKYSILEWLWLLRTMWDDLLFKVGNGKVDELEARSICNLIIKQLDDLYDEYYGFPPEDRIGTSAAIRKFKEEIKKAKSKIYRVEIDEKEISDYMKDY